MAVDVDQRLQGPGSKASSGCSWFLSLKSRLKGRCDCVTTSQRRKKKHREGKRTSSAARKLSFLFLHLSPSTSLVCISTHPCQSASSSCPSFYVDKNPSLPPSTPSTFILSHRIPNQPLTHIQPCLLPRNPTTTHCSRTTTSTIMSTSRARSTMLQLP